MPEPGLVILRVKRPRPVEVDSGARMYTAHGHQTKRRRLQRHATLQGVVQSHGDEGADVEAAGPGWSLGEIIVLTIYSMIFTASTHHMVGPLAGATRIHA